MNKYLFIVALLLISTSGASIVSAQALNYTPLEPIQGLTLDTTSPNALPLLLERIFIILFSLGGLLAVVMLTLGGITYMMSSVPGIKAQGLERAKAAIYGILILAASYLILNTINPDLVRLKPILVDIAQQQDPTTNPPGTNDPRIPTAVCNSSRTNTAQFSVYYANETCTNAVRGKLTGGDILNNRATQQVIVFRTANAVLQWRNALDTFVGSCVQSQGVVKSFSETTSANELIYVCLTRR